MLASNGQIKKLERYISITMAADCHRNRCLSSTKGDGYFMSYIYRKLCKRITRASTVYWLSRQATEHLVGLQGIMHWAFLYALK